MCGMIAANLSEPVLPVLVKSLRALEYRGYDSHGYLTVTKDKILVEKFLDAPSKAEPGKMPGDVGMAHCRWASVGQVSIPNTHPIIYSNGDTCRQVYVVHNGTFLNTMSQATVLFEQDIEFQSGTDTELLAYYLWLNLPSSWDKKKSLSKAKDFLDAYRAAGDMLKGDFSSCAISELDPTVIGCCTRGMSLYVAPGLCASDPIALAGLTKKCYRLKDMEVFVMGKGWGFVFTGDRWKDVGECCDQDVPELGQSEGMADDIQAQHRYVAPPVNLPSRDEYIFFGCGSSYHACLYGERLFRRKGLKARAVLAHDVKGELSDGLWIGLSQSGETKDVVNAFRYLKEVGATTAAVVNNPISTCAGLARFTHDLRCGLERGVAATKSFTAMLWFFHEFLKKHTGSGGRNPTDVFDQILTEEILKIISDISIFKSGQSIFILGEGLYYPIALEGALKLKEVALVHAEGLNSRELKHGPLALVQGRICIFLYPKFATVSEVVARGGNVIALVLPEEVATFKKLGAISFGMVNIETTPFVASAFFQLMAYYTACFNGVDPNFPEGLCKSVTVD